MDLTPGTRVTVPESLVRRAPVGARIAATVHEFSPYKPNPNTRTMRKAYLVQVDGFDDLKFAFARVDACDIEVAHG